MKPLILGEAPSRTGDKYWMVPMSGQISMRMAQWAGIDPLEEGSKYGRWYWSFREHFDVQNLIERWPGGDGFPMDVARREADALLPELDGRVVVMLGSRLRRVFGLPAVHDWTANTDGGAMSWIYHPSGLTRQYNDPAHREAAGLTLRRAMELAAI